MLLKHACGRKQWNNVAKFKTRYYFCIEKRFLYFWNIITIFYFNFLTYVVKSHVNVFLNFMGSFFLTRNLMGAYKKIYNNIFSHYLKIHNFIIPSVLNLWSFNFLILFQIFNPL
jgi:hypothetical protein